MRVVVNYRILNAATKKNVSLPNMQDMLDALPGSQFFSNMDLASGFWQVKVKPSNCEKTAFKTPFGLFWSVVFINDLITYSKTFDDQLQ